MSSNDALRQAAQQALEALELHAKQYPHMQKGYTVDAITALRAALAEPVQEPMPHQYPLQSDRMRIDPVTGDVGIGTPSAEPVQEPVAFAHINGTSDTKWHPPQRKPLTEEEIRDLWSWAMTAEAERIATTQQHAFARAIERAHGIKE